MEPFLLHGPEALHPWTSWQKRQEDRKPSLPRKELGKYTCPREQERNTFAQAQLHSSLVTCGSFAHGTIRAKYVKNLPCQVRFAQVKRNCIPGAGFP